MKKTLSILAVAALAVGASLQAAENVVTIKPKLPYHEKYGWEVPSISYGKVIATQATLENPETGGTITYDKRDGVEDVIEAPFDIGEGISFSTLTLEEAAISGDVDKLIIDFTDLTDSYQTPLYWGLYLDAGHTGNYDDIEGADDVDYLLIKINGINFAEWYAQNGSVEIIGRFHHPENSIVETSAYVIVDACDTPHEGRIAFFSKDVIAEVSNAEVVPEPTTATLSLLALAGLAARRRRR